MLTNASLADGSMPNTHLFTLYVLMKDCFKSAANIYIFSVLCIINFLLLPFFVYVLYLACKQLRQQHRSSTAVASSSDHFLLHSIVMQLNLFIGFSVMCFGSYNGLYPMIVTGLCLWPVTTLGQSLLQLLTCVEHYIAVVKPVTYLKLRQALGVRIRRICLACVWLLSLLNLIEFSLASHKLNLITNICSFGVQVVVVSFCSVSVLCALKRPGPGEVDGKGDHVDQSKRRAFYTVTAITAVLLLRLVANLVSTILFMSTQQKTSAECAMFLFDIWFELPSSLILPLMFLHRAGRLQCCKQPSESD